MLQGSAARQTSQGRFCNQTRDGEETHTICGKAKRAHAVRIIAVNRGIACMAIAVLIASCASPAPTPSPTVPATPQPTADLTAQIEAVIASVPAVRELQPTRDVPFEFITREQFQADVANLTNNVPADVRAAEERLYKRLGLLPADADMNALEAQLYGSQVLAYYQPDDGHFYIIGPDESFNPTDKIVVAHEYTHALQDQHFDLKDNTITDPEQGDATLTSQLWASSNLGFGDMLQMLLDGFSQLDQSSLQGIPLILRRQLEFPYTEGFAFVTALHDQGGYDAVNEALTTPPASTEQILHPEKYFAHEAPAPVPTHVRVGAVGDPLTLVYSQTLGELGIQVLALGSDALPTDIPGLPVDWPHADVAAGWGGDRLNMYEAPSGAWLVDWTTVWDTGADAISFRSRMDEISGTFTGSTDLQITDQTVEVMVTSN